MQVLTEEEKSNLLKEWDGTLLGLIDDVETQMLEKLRQQEPVAWILDYQTMGGTVGQKLSWSRSGAEVCRRLQGWEHEHPLYAAPVPADMPDGCSQMDLDDAIQHAEERANTVTNCGKEHARLAMWLRDYRARLSAAPALPDDVVKDAERYRWLKGQHENNGEWHVKGSPSWIPMPLDAAIDYAMQKGTNNGL